MGLDVQSTYELPMHALRASESLPPLRDEPFGFIGIRTLCDALVDDMAIPRRGGYSPEIQTRIVATKKIAQVLMARGDVSTDGPKNGKEKAAAKQADHLKQLLRGFGIDISRIDTDEAFILKELADALDVTNKMIEAAEPLFEQSDASVFLTADAIADWMDMFIKLHQRFELDDDQVRELFRHLFTEGKINKLLKGNQLDRIFTRGLYGELSAYLHLYNEKQGEGRFTVPRKANGADSAVDLIWEDEEGPNIGIEYYDVKSDVHVDEPVLVDVTDDEQYAAYVTEMNATYSRSDHVLRGRLRSADRLRTFAAEAGRHNPSARFYSMRVPSLAREDTI